MKKILAVILSLMMILSLCACSDEPEYEEPAVDEPAIEEPSDKPIEEPAEEPEVAAKRGKVENGVFTNEVFKITFDGGDEWYFYTDEEIAATYGVTMDYLTDEYAQIIEEATLIYDMYAINSLTGDTVNIIYENLGLVYGSIFEEKAYLELSKTQLDDQFAAAGFTVVKNEVSSVSIGGEEVSCLEITIDYGGLYIYEIIVPKKVGQWMGVITIGSIEEEKLLSIAEKLSFE